MRGLGTVLKFLERSNNTVLFNLPFTLFRRILSTRTSPIAVLVPPCSGCILCHKAFYADGLRVCTSGSPLPRRLEKGYFDIEKQNKSLIVCQIQDLAARYLNAQLTN